MNDRKYGFMLVGVMVLICTSEYIVEVIASYPM